MTSSVGLWPREQGLGFTVKAHGVKVFFLNIEVLRLVADGHSLPWTALVYGLGPV